MDDRNSPERERWHRPPIEGDFKKIRVIYPGIDTNDFNPHRLKRCGRQLGLQPTISLSQSPAVSTALAAKANANSSAPLHQFTIKFQTRASSSLAAATWNRFSKSDIEQLGLQGKAWLTGQMSDMPQVMNAIDCLVHPQIGTEALALVVCEAHACGKPVIASDLDGIPEAFAAGNLGQLVPPEDVNELAEAMVAQINSPVPTDAAKTRNARSS